MTEDDFLLELSRHYEANLPFVAYSLPNKSELTVNAFLQKDAQLHCIKDFSEKGFVFAPFDTTQPVFYFPEEACELMQAEMDKVKSETKKKSPIEKPILEEKAAYIKIVEKAIARLKSGDLQKVVLSRREAVPIENRNPISIFRKLTEAYPEAFVYCWFHPKVGLWLGATPETLFQIKESHFKTMALAGTKKYEGTTKVEWGKKEKQEQQYVTDAVWEGLQKMNFNRLKKSEVYSSRAGNLLHLCTDITAEIDTDRKPVKALVKTLHPTPAVCGLPREDAKSFILKNEGYSREFYTGFLGELNIQKLTLSKNKHQGYTIDFETRLFVNLRCMKLQNSNAVLYVGGGITKDSVPEDEWQETHNKAATLKNVLSKSSKDFFFGK